MYIKAIGKGNFAIWPSLTSDNVRKYLPKSDVMVKGHLKRHRQHIRSTQPIPDADDPTLDLEQEGKCHAIYFTRKEEVENFLRF
jgi:hypothetical protein